MHHASSPTSPNRIIRPATAHDADAVRCLTRAAYAKWVKVIGREPLPMVADHAAAVRDHQVDLLFADDELVGLIEMIMAPDHLRVENVAIRPLSQRRGFGRHLMVHAEAVAARADRQLVRLYTNQAFASNVVLYEALGYRIDCRTQYRGGTTVHMSKRL